MANEAMRAQVADLLESVRSHIAAVQRARQERDRLMATAQAGDGRVSVRVDARGFVTQVQFADDIGELDYDEIARAVAAAAYDAATAVTQEAARVMAAANRLPASFPDYSEVVPGMPDFEPLRRLLAQSPKPPDVQPGSHQSPESSVRDAPW